MQTKKISLANIKGKLSRAEMKNIMAGSGDDGGRCTVNGYCTSNTCTTQSGRTGYCYANGESGNGRCYCVTAY